MTIINSRNTFEQTFHSRLQLEEPLRLLSEPLEKILEALNRKDMI